MRADGEPMNSPIFASANTKKRPSCFLGLDVGGTKIAAGIVTFPDGKVHARRIISTQPQRGGEAVLADAEQIAVALVEEARAKELHIDGIGVGVCEIVDLSGQIASANCLAWQAMPVRERLSRIAPTVLDADVRAAARAEALFGAGCRARTFLYVTIGTGISSCLVIDGVPFTGAQGATGSLASAPFPQWNAADVACPQPSLEEFTAGPALVARFNQTQNSVRSGREVLEAAAAGNAVAIRVVRSAGEALGAAIGWLVNVLDPEIVVLGGGLGLSEGLYRDALTATARKHIWWERHRDVPIVSAATGADAGIIGAAATAWKRD